MSPKWTTQVTEQIPSPQHSGKDGLSLRAFCCYISTWISIWLLDQLDIYTLYLVLLTQYYYYDRNCQDWTGGLQHWDKNTIFRVRSEFNSEDLFIRFVVFTETAKLPFYWVLRKIWNVLHQIHLEIRDWSVKISVSWLQPAACRQWFVLNLFQREKEGKKRKERTTELPVINTTLRWMQEEESWSVAIMLFYANYFCTSKDSVVVRHDLSRR